LAIILASQQLLKFHYGDYMNSRLTLLAASLAVIAAGPTMAGGHLMGNPVALASSQQSASLMAKLAAKHELGQDQGYMLANEYPGVAGTKITRLHHSYKGVRIWHSESVVVTDSSGEIMSESMSDRRNSRGMDVDAKIKSSDAMDSMVAQLSPNGTHIVPPSAELIIFPIMKSVRVASAANKAEPALNAMDLVEEVDSYELAYLVKTRMLNNGIAVLFDSIISAKDGRLLQRINAKHSLVGTGYSQYNGTVPVNTTLSGGTYSMLDATRGTGGTYGGLAITNANHGTTAGSIYTNTSNTWGDGTQYNGGSTINANGQTAAVNALWGAMNTYDTMKNVLGWQSLNGQNTAFYIAVHVNNNYDNAYYSDSCKCMFIGDGSSFYNLGSIDVIGHEMGHGITAATSNLTYAAESGGLNESNSDITGEMVEAYARNGGTGTIVPGGNDWEVGLEIAKNGVALRHMRKPSQDGGSADAWSSTIKNLDVHYNSGPNNRMFYFLSQGSNSTVGNVSYSAYLNKAPLAMTGIGNDKAFRIWFKALTTKFTASTNYADARNKVVTSAQELYGVGSAEDIAVQRAYAAINVGSDVAESGGGSGTPVSISGQPSSVSVAAGATASFAVTATGGTASYNYQWQRNGANISGATSAAYSLVTASIDNGAVFSATVTDSATSPTTATSGNATLTVTSGGGTSSEAVTNGDFESGTSPWVGTTGAISTWSGQPAYDGSRNAWLGGYGSTSNESLYQAVTVPSSGAPKLTFALHIDTAESTTRTAYDKLVVTVKNSAGATLQTLATYSNLNKASGYQIRTFDLSAYKGQAVRISFVESEDSSLQTSFVLDAISVK
jgi:Zn-dependent metalloprotease